MKLVILSFEDINYQLFQNLKDGDEILIDVGPNKFTALRRNMAFVLGFSATKNVLVRGFSGLEVTAKFLQKDIIRLKSRATQFFEYNSDKNEFKVVNCSKEDLDDFDFFDFAEINLNDLKEYIAENISEIERPLMALYLQEADAVPNLPPPLIDLKSGRNRKLDGLTLKEKAEQFYEMEQIFDTSLRFSKSRLLNLLEDELAEDFLEENACAIVKYPVFSDEPVDLLTIAVRKGECKKGYGESILKRIIQTVAVKGYRRIMLDVAETNIAARSLYEKLGFEKTSTTKKFYQNGDTAIHMTLNLKTQTVKLPNLGNFATKFAEELKRGDILFLNGDLGSGKTTFTAALVKALGGKTSVISPTFTLAKEYEISIPEKMHLLHVDAYRNVNLENGKTSTFESLVNSGIFENQENQITVVEWGESFANKLRKRNSQNRVFELLIDEIDDETRQFTTLEIGGRCSF